MSSFDSKLGESTLLTQFRAAYIGIHSWFQITHNHHLMNTCVAKCVLPKYNKQWKKTEYCSESNFSTIRNVLKAHIEAIDEMVQ